MKKAIALLLVIALTAAVAIGGTLAYLTDRENETNVFTMGDVKIELDNEFKQGIELTPGVVVDNTITITNTGKNDAWVWYAVKFDKCDSSVIDVGNIGAEWTQQVSPEYGNVQLLKAPLAAGKSETVDMKIALDPTVDIAPDGKLYEVVGGNVNDLGWNVSAGNPVAYINAYAIQTDTFTTVEAAYEAYNLQWGDKGTAYEPAENVVTNEGELKDALKNASGETVITVVAPFAISGTVTIPADATINGCGFTLSRADGFTGNMFSVEAGTALTLEDVTIDGGRANGVTATGNLITTGANAAIMLNEGAVLQNNDGAHAVNLGTRIGATLTINGGEIINNKSGSGAIWGGGNITLNSGKINNNSSTGVAGAIRMVSSCNLTINGGEISGNTAAGDGGAIWGYGSSTYTFTGGEISGNTSAGTGGAIYTGTSSVIKISGDFEMCNNQAANSGAIRLTDHTSMTITGGTISGNTQNGASNAFNTWNNSISITGGKVNDNISYVGGLGLTVGAADINGVISYNLATNHNTAYLAADFNGFKFTVDENSAYFANFNFKPAAGYTYTEGDEAKLVCLNEGYVTYWHAATGTFRLQAK